jgi:hypothetical protein
MTPPNRALSCRTEESDAITWLTEDIHPDDVFGHS